ncbi:unknown protein [Microcystis aeruginosa NIES-843]|uniref:Uncharacterized protein n=1 Tax=Microcystis aeruginosa (strain NIES-843 / IAM M-2473) TaxID=449447 RepID=B0JNY5_MICAN|nr:unknown protein [Microcystis aeruginosa NIES-843]
MVFSQRLSPQTRTLQEFIKLKSTQINVLVMIFSITISSINCRSLSSLNRLDNREITRLKSYPPVSKTSSTFVLF